MLREIRNTRQVPGEPPRRWFFAHDQDLPPESQEARICSFECTFCRVCTEKILKGRCPNCGGELVSRPRRPADKLQKFPPSTERVYKPEGCKQVA